MRQFRYDTVDSTNDAARRLLNEGRIDGDAYVVAREQTAGRGTQGRVWASPRDAGLYLSVVVTRPGSVGASTKLITVAAGAACAEVIEQSLGLRVGLSGVNDLVAAGGKLGGILTEATASGANIDAIIVGVGLNTRRAPRDLPPDALPAVNLEDLLSNGRLGDSDIDALALAIAQRIAVDVRRIASGDTAWVRAAWQSYSHPETQWPA